VNGWGYTRYASFAGPIHGTIYLVTLTLLRLQTYLKGNLMQPDNSLNCLLTLKQATGGILPPCADFVEVRKVAKQIERRFFEKMLTII